MVRLSDLLNDIQRLSETTDEIDIDYYPIPMIDISEWRRQSEEFSEDDLVRMVILDSFLESHLNLMNRNLAVVISKLESIINEQNERN